MVILKYLKVNVLCLRLDPSPTPQVSGWAQPVAHLVVSTPIFIPKKASVNICPFFKH